MLFRKRLLNLCLEFLTPRFSTSCDSVLLLFTWGIGYRPRLDIGNTILHDFNCRLHLIRGAFFNRLSSVNAHCSPFACLFVFIPHPTAPHHPPEGGGGIVESLCPSVVLSLCPIVSAQHLLKRSTIFYQTWYGDVLS